MQFASKHYPHLKMVRSGTSAVTDEEGNFNLMCASERGLRLLARLRTQPRYRHPSLDEALADRTQMQDGHA